MQYIFKLLPFFLLASFVFYSCTDERQNANESDVLSVINCETITHENADNCLHLNQIQVFGTHNSYKLYPHPDLVERLNEYVPGWADNITYEHRPIREQLGELKMRQLEIDIFADPNGGLYSEPAGALLIDDTEFIRHPELMKPGFKVLHVQDTDYRTTCITFKSCLKEVRDWSLENPSHLPIMILVEVKQRRPESRGTLIFSEPVQFDEQLMLEIDEEIWSIFSRDHVITPDDVREGYETLEKAILEKGWPTLGESRGKVFFGLDNTDSSRDIYLSGAPVLEGRALFVSSPPGEPSAAFIKMNDAIGAFDRIQENVAAGYVIRSRSDTPMHEATTGDTTRLTASLSSGAQYISTDYPEPSPFGSGFIAAFPDTDGPGRCNPVSAPPGCQNEFITE